MAQTKIEWTATVLPDGTVLPGYTFNPWIGCIKVSEGCEHCYAEALNHRWGHDNWGPAKTTQRVRTSENYWKQPLKWNKEAEKSGIRRKVFCASLADVFEDNEQVKEWRLELFELIDNTPHLDWLLLTKRIENVNKMLPFNWQIMGYIPDTVWMGVTIENNDIANERILDLLKVPASIRFLSCEPLLENITPGYLHEIDWVICGGESGPKKRPFNLQWAYSLKEQCETSGVPFFMKQIDKIQPIPDDLMIRQFPESATDSQIK